MAEPTECQFHNNCGGWCETPEQVAANLCEDCMEADQLDASHTDAVAELRRALEFLDSCRASGGAALDTGSLQDAREWIESAARKVVGMPDRSTNN